MSNPSKIKGNAFERDATNILNSLVNKSCFRRIPSSGSIGTILKEPLLTSDIKGAVESIPKTFKIEAKVGYNTSKDREVKQFTLKKEWLDKIKLEADSSYSFPMLIGKFSGAREGVKVFVVLDVTVFAELLNIVTELHEEIEKYERDQLGKDKGLL